MARKKVGKNIYFDEEKKLYYVYMDYGKDENGKRIRKQPTFKTKSEANKALKEFEANKTKGTLVKPKSETVGEWLTYWLTSIASNSCEESTLYGYKNIVNRHIIPSLGEIPLQKIKPQQIQNYYNDKLNDEESPLSENTVRKHHALLKTAFQVAVQQDMLISNPLDKVIKPKYIRPEINVYNAEEMKKLFKAAEGTRLEVVIWILGMTGIRRSELCGLKWNNIDFNNKIISIKNTRINVGTKIIEKNRTKNISSTRKISISDELIDVLNKERQSQSENKELLGKHYIDNDYVIVMENGKPYRPNYLSELFTKFINNNNLPPITLHGLRHSLASVANNAGINLYEISKILGHSNTSTTSKIYISMFDDTHKESMGAIVNEFKNDKDEDSG